MISTYGACMPCVSSIFIQCMRARRLSLGARRLSLGARRLSDTIFPFLVPQVLDPNPGKKTDGMREQHF